MLIRTALDLLQECPLPMLRHLGATHLECQNTRTSPDPLIPASTATAPDSNSDREGPDPLESWGRSLTGGCGVTAE